MQIIDVKCEKISQLYEFKQLMSARRNFKFAVEELKNYSVKIFS